MTAMGTRTARTRTAWPTSACRRRQRDGQGHSCFTRVPPAGLQPAPENSARRRSMAGPNPLKRPSAVRPAVAARWEAPLRPAANWRAFATRAGWEARARRSSAHLLSRTLVTCPRARRATGSVRSPPPEEGAHPLAAPSPIAQLRPGKQPPADVAALPRFKPAAPQARRAFHRRARPSWTRLACPDPVTSPARPPIPTNTSILLASTTRGPARRASAAVPRGSRVRAPSWPITRRTAPGAARPRSTEHSAPASS
jgi:hypothetical protein